ncbi:NADPH:quinone reductase [Leuconostoc litchii]|uniref:Zinc-type alcohol dehydrogenase-like protein n=1 Tax=Leuconostoc litchii TaxID=1981069 RepID=A0A6P2CM15_9LACO|nr:zinc-binding alcohol dehydrogenase family protein [Leuconostoc litchii]TYC46916.1 zinc-binding alcohol dehydrogenase family protein [Leuconostoc litchii]GMA68819.1 NADPH:quinone reductase [Leuconostoc litchii]
MNLLDKIKNIWPFGQNHKMRAIGFEHSLTIDTPNVFIEKEILRPQPSKNELLVKVLASSVNPVDTKMRANYANDGEFRILGFDAVGVVIEVGQNVSRFSVGDKVYYAGSQLEAGSDAEFQVVHEELVGHAPSLLKNEEIAAMPLTSITAYEILNEALGYELKENSAVGHTILILNGAGGVGSVLIQLAKYVGMTVITTASRTESVTWVKSLGADFILDYHQDLGEQLRKIQHPKVDNIAILQDTNYYWSLVLAAIKPFGRIASIVETTKPIDMGPLKNIGAQFNWVFMFAKGNYGVNMQIQGNALDQVAFLLDNNKIKTTLTKTYYGLTVDNIRAATKDVETNRMIGKVVVKYDE